MYWAISGTIINQVGSTEGQTRCQIPEAKEEEEEEDGIMTTATGISPHIELANQIQKVLDLTTNLMTCFGDQTNKVIEAVQTAMEEKAWESGHATGSRLLEVLNEFQQKSLTSVDERLVE